MIYYYDEQGKVIGGEITTDQMAYEQAVNVKVKKGIRIDTNLILKVQIVISIIIFLVGLYVYLR